MEKFTINGKVYFVKDLDFEYLVVLDKNGINVDNVTGLAAINCFVAYCGGITETQASKEISAHIMNGGKLNDIVDIYAKTLSESGFFRALLEQTTDGQAEMGETDKETPKKSKKTVKAEVSE